MPNTNEDTADLAVDEFERIEPLLREIQGICARGKSNLLSRYPLLKQRDDLQERVHRLEREIDRHHTQRSQLIADRDEREKSMAKDNEGLHLRVSQQTAHLAELDRKLGIEKKLRLEFQDVVYGCCNEFDQIMGNIKRNSGVLWRNLPAAMGSSLTRKGMVTEAGAPAPAVNQVAAQPPLTCGTSDVCPPDPAFIRWFEKEKRSLIAAGRESDLSNYYMAMLRIWERCKRRCRENS